MAIQSAVPRPPVITALLAGTTCTDQRVKLKMSASRRPIELEDDQVAFTVDTEKIDTVYASAKA